MILWWYSKYVLKHRSKSCIYNCTPSFIIVIILILITSYIIIIIIIPCCSLILLLSLLSYYRFRFRAAFRDTLWPIGHTHTHTTWLPVSKIHGVFIEMSSLAAEENVATATKAGETIHQLKLRHRAEVKALKSKIEKRRKEATRGLKGKQKKLALSELKSKIAKRKQIY